MATKKEIITKAAVKLGYEGDAPKTTAQAIDALAVALGGTASGGSIAEATKALVAAVGGGDEDTPKLSGDENTPKA